MKLLFIRKTLFAFDGETGAQTDVSTNWESALSLPHTEHGRVQPYLTLMVMVLLTY